MWCQSFSYASNLLSFRYITKIVGLVLAATILVTVSGSVAAPAVAGTRATAARARVVKRAVNQIGTRYRWGAESPKKGFDCSGLTKWAFATEGVYLPHSSLMQYKLAGSKGFKRVH